MAAQPSTPKESAIISMVSGGIVTLIAVLLLVFGGPARPGQRRNALFYALEQMLGYEGACGLLIAVGVIVLVLGVVRYRKAVSTA
jgi:hypothetical protein